MEDFNYIYILDYGDATICEIQIVDSMRDKTIEDIIEQAGCNINTCSWMCTVGKIESITKLI